MVVFTCNTCGQSVKKNQVEKHYSFQCRNCDSLTCMDCNKEFFGDEYKTHVKCITEDEKYGGKNYVAKPASQKGLQKQEKWIERINLTVKSKKLSPMLSSIVDQLVGFENIPRKKAKFENFVQNSFRLRDPHLIAQVWELFSASQEETNSGSTEHTAESTKGVKRNCQESAPAENGINKNGVKKSRRNTENDDDNPKCPVESEAQQSRNFKWKKAIKTILKQQDSKTLSLKALRKLVFAEYQACLESECSLTKEEFKAMLVEKIGKCSKFELDGKYVKLS